MADELPVGCAVVVAYQRCAGVEMRNIFGFRPVAGQNGDASGLVTAFEGAVNTTFKSLRSQDWSVYKFQARWQQAAGQGVVLSDFLAGAGPGAVALAARPLHDSLVVSLRSARAGKANRGRIYLGGYATDAVNGQNWTQAVQDNATAIAQALFNVFSPSGTNTQWRLAVLHRPHDARNVVRKVNHVPTIVAQPAYAGGYEDLISFVVDPQVFTQRRRTLGVGQ
jgi:hypothetical protein